MDPVELRWRNMFKRFYYIDGKCYSQGVSIREVVEKVALATGWEHTEQVGNIRSPRK